MAKPYHPPERDGLDVDACVFCGASDIAVRVDNLNDRVLQVYVECRACGARGPTVKHRDTGCMRATVERAVFWWGERAMG